MIWKFLKQNDLFPRGLNWVQHWVSRIGLLGKAQESSRKRCRTFQETWKTRRPWLKFDEKENAMFCSYCRQFLKDKSAFGSEKGNNSFRLDGIKKHEISEAHKTTSCISFLAWTGARAWTTKIFYGQPNQVLWLPQGQLDIKVNFEPCKRISRMFYSLLWNLKP